MNLLDSSGLGILYPTLTRLLGTSAKALMNIAAVFRGLGSPLPELKFGASTGSMDALFPKAP